MIKSLVIGDWIQSLAPSLRGGVGEGEAEVVFEEFMAEIFQDWPQTSVHWFQKLHGAPLSLCEKRRHLRACGAGGLNWGEEQCKTGPSGLSNHWAFLSLCSGVRSSQWGGSSRTSQCQGGGVTSGTRHFPPWDATSFLPTKSSEADLAWLYPLPSGTRSQRR